MTRDEVVSKVAKYVARTYGGVDTASFRAAFLLHDYDRDGRLSTEEVATILAKAGVGFRLTRWAIAKEILAALDTDDDGYVEWLEFQAVFNG